MDFPLDTAVHRRRDTSPSSSSPSSVNSMDGRLGREGFPLDTAVHRRRDTSPPSSSPSSVNSMDGRLGREGFPLDIVVHRRRDTSPPSSSPSNHRMWREGVVMKAARRSTETSHGHEEQDPYGEHEQRIYTNDNLPSVRAMVLFCESNLDEVERKRNDQGLHECEVFGPGPETMESERTWMACKKHPGHVKFIPYPEFRLENLPGVVRTLEYFDCVRNMADRTVRLRVGYTCKERPKDFPFANLGGSHIEHTGTGWVEDVHKHRGPTCPCLKCLNSSSPHQNSYEIIVHTASHVVYNTEEARETQVDFFHDDERSMQMGKTKTVWGLDIFDRYPSSDNCFLRCITHDADLAKKLGCKGKVAVPYEIEPWRVMPRFGDVCVIVSHPHGKPKMVTVGQTEKTHNDHEKYRVTYTTKTCPGSSGAPVVLLLHDLDPDLIECSIVHSQGRIRDGLNQGSSLTRGWIFGDDRVA